MDLGTYADGRQLSYDEDTHVFSVGSYPVTADQVAAYDAAGQLSWLSADQRDWFFTYADMFPDAEEASEPSVRPDTTEPVRSESAVPQSGFAENDFFEVEVAEPAAPEGTAPEPMAATVAFQQQNEGQHSTTKKHLPKWALIAVVGVIVLACGGCSVVAALTPNNSVESVSKPPLKEPGTSSAKDQLAQTEAYVGETTQAEFASQMPQGVTVDAQEDGDYRTYTWTFSDGSAIVATFVADGSDTAEANALLSSLDIE